MIVETQFFIRLLLSAVLGGIIGLEREWSHKVAGLRTHALVALGATLLSIISISAFPQTQGMPMTSYDPARIISNIIVGIGFIGGGAILRRGPRVHGITTAATLWITAVIGIAVGVGFIREAIFTTAVVYFVLTVLWLLEKKVTRLRNRDNKSQEVENQENE